MRKIRLSQHWTITGFSFILFGTFLPLPHRLQYFLEKLTRAQKARSYSMSYFTRRRMEGSPCRWYQRWFDAMSFRPE